MQRFNTSEACARRLDSDDSLKGFRRRFYIPENTVYLDGNSLGLLSKDAEEPLYRVLGEWKDLGIRGWLEAKQPWFYFAERLGEMASPLVGAKPDEVVATGTTTVNIHALLSTFYHTNGKRRKILADALNFPTDIYAMESHLRLRGCDPEEDLILTTSEDGRLLNEETIAAMMSDEVALIFLPSVLYRSGQLLDMAALIREAHAKNIPIGFDCSHSVGTIPHQFDAWGLDFALWCSYKYINGGPGSTAFLYVNRKHFRRGPGMAGWFGYVKSRQFDMLLNFEHQQAAGGWQVSSPGILGSAPLEGALRIILEAGVESIREKSLNMTSYLIFLVDELLSASPYSFSVDTPREPERRGGHVALERDEETWRICEALRSKGFITDFRAPNVIRIAPAALYNTYHEVWRAVQTIKRIIDTKEYTRFDKRRKDIP